MRKYSNTPVLQHYEGRNPYSQTPKNRKRESIGRVVEYNAVPKERLDSRLEKITSRKQLIAKSSAVITIRKVQADSIGDYEMAARCRDLLDLMNKEKNSMRWKRGEWDKTTPNILETMQGKTQDEIDAINYVKEPYTSVCDGYTAEEQKYPQLNSGLNA